MTAILLAAGLYLDYPGFAAHSAVFLGDPGPILVRYETPEPHFIEVAPGQPWWFTGVGDWTFVFPEWDDGRGGSAVYRFTSDPRLAPFVFEPIRGDGEEYQFQFFGGGAWRVEIPARGMLVNLLPEPSAAALLTSAGLSVLFLLARRRLQ